MSIIRRNNEKGYTLIIVLWTLVILGIIFSALIEEVSLNNNLLEYNLREQKIRELMVSGVMLAINKLKTDETTFDTIRDQWHQVVKGEQDGIKYEVEILDAASKVNINYSAEALLKGFDWWNEELMERRNRSIIPDLVFIRSILGEDYQDARKLLTIYGNYNLNADPVEGLEKLLRFLDISEQQIKIITNNLKEFRDEGKQFQSIEQFPLEIEGVDLATFEKIKPYLGITGRVNINLVEDAILALYLETAGVSKKYVEELIEYREEHDIEELDQIYKLLPDDAATFLTKHFSASSTFFLISISIKPEDTVQSYLYRVLVEREYDGEEWQVKVIKWDTV